MQAVYGAAHDTATLQALLQTEDAERAPSSELTLQEFIAALRSGFPAFDVMHEVTATACN